MKYLTATICLTIAVLVGCGGVSDSADSQNKLAAAQEEGIATDFRELTLLAEQGNSTAQNSLGLMYATGEGVPQDFETAVKWFTLAAEQKNSEAQLNLGVAYETGLGVPQDDVYAHMWFNIAASSGVDDAPERRGIVAEQMTPTQIEEAQKLARECVRKEYKGC